MSLVSVIWIKLVEHSPISKRLNINDKTVVLFIYSLSASIIALFTKRDFFTAAIIAGGSMILPIFEELYFRAFLLAPCHSTGPV